MDDVKLMETFPCPHCGTWIGEDAVGECPCCGGDLDEYDEEEEEEEEIEGEE